MRRFAIALVFVVGCSGGDDGDDVAVDPPITHPVPVTVHVPSGTAGPIYIAAMPFDDYAETSRVELAPRGGDVWTGEVELETGALARYVYDRWDGVAPQNDQKDRREASGDHTTIDTRYVIATADAALDDTVETWADQRDLRAPVGDLTGTVRDAATGAPLVDATVSVGGVHTATGYDGSFVLEAIARGTQRVVVTTTLGDHAMAQTSVELGASAHVDIALDAAPAVAVTFDAELPASTPADADVRLVGNVYQLGARHFGTFPNHPEALSLPITDRSTPGHARIAIQLHAGQYVQYYYSIGGDSAGGEVLANPRSFVASGDTTRADRVAAWVADGQHLVRVHVAVPPDTGMTPVALQLGPSHWMAAPSAGERVFYMAFFPGVALHYRYVLGGDQQGADDAGMRDAFVGDADVALDDVVVRWSGSPPASPAVTFRAAVPADTVGTVRVIGSGPRAGGVDRVAMPGEPAQRSASVEMSRGTAISYHYEDGAGARSPDFAVTVPYGAVDDAVAAWSTAPLPAGGTRPDYITGAYLPDYWSPSFAALSAPTFDRLRAHHVGWVALSSVWSYGHIQPLPTIELRPRFAGSVATPREDLRTQAQLARAKGLHVVLAPQFNMEMSPGGMAALNEPKSPAWWTAWLGCARTLWLWNASLAEEVGAEVLVLPGPVFHVFYGSGNYGSPADEDAFDAQVSALVAEVRAVYHGKVMISGSSTRFAFPGAADLVGFTTYDLGRPALPYDASADEWTTAYESLFEGHVDYIHHRWGKPVVAYTIALQVDPSDPDPTSEAMQSRQLDGVMRAIAARPWIAGSLSWAYTMVDVPALPGDGVRGHAAEGMLARSYATFAP